jgi:hypothetical protein
MITGLGIGLIGFGLLLAYAGVTGQHVKQELGEVFTGGGLGGGGLNAQAAAGLLPPPAPSASKPPAPAAGMNPLPAGTARDTGNILIGLR